MLDSNDTQSLDFVAPDQQTFDYWVDGINALLGNFNFLNIKKTVKDLAMIILFKVQK